MEIKNLSDIEERKIQIASEVDSADEETLKMLSEELEQLEVRKKEIETINETRKKEMEDVINGKGEVISKMERKDEKVIEVRNTKEYIDAFANYIKTGDDKECRKLLTENNTTSGTVPVPELVEGRIRTAWQKNEVMARVSKTYLKGNVKIGFEISSTGADIHVEGDKTFAEEELVLGIATLIPQSIKKWITISDEVYDLNGQEFLDYIYDELTYQIAKKAANVLINAIINSPATSDAKHPGVPSVSLGVAANTIVQAAALLSDEAVNPVVIMNKQTAAAFKSITTMDGYLLANPFDGLEVIYDNTLPVYSAAETNAVYAIVGDLYTGARANFPNGEEITFKFDELSLAEYDLIKIVGREYVGIGVVAPNRFVTIKKPSA